MLENKTWLFTIFIVLLVITGCDGVIRGPTAKVPYETVSFNSSDNITLVADYYPSNSDQGIILLHMLARTRATYRDVAAKLVPYYKVIAVDFRGHGDSQGEYDDLTDDDFKLMTRDVEAAALFLQTEGVAEENISLVGASIGANLALLYAMEHPVKNLLLLSPGLSYHGIDISRQQYNGYFLIQVGHYDAYSSISVDELELLLPHARVMSYDSSAHGTDLLQYDVSAYEDFFFYLT